jgi:hypothetical protein
MSAPTAPRHRHLRVRWSLLVATALTLVAIVALRRAEPDYERKIAPLPVPGKVGERVVARNFAITVKRARLARAYVTRPKSFDGPPRRVLPDGIWMSALVEVEALREPGSVSARLRTRDGLFYQLSGSDRPDVDAVNLAQKRFSPGLRVSGAFFFDVPRDRLQGARLEFFWGALPIPPGMDHRVDIDLGLDAAATRVLLAEARPEIDLR